MSIRKLTLIALIILLIMLEACISNSSEERLSIDSDLTSYPEFDVNPLPPFIFDTSPQHGSIIAEKQYQSSSMYDFDQPGICIEFDIASLLEDGDFYNSVDELLPRFMLEVDGKQFKEVDFVFLRDILGYTISDLTSGEPRFHVPDGSPPDICYAVDLKAGMHTATLTARKTSGDKLSYTWSFYLLTDEEVMARATPTLDVIIPYDPEPRYIGYVYPTSASIQTLDEYSQREHLGMPAPGICVSFIPYPFLLEPGDDLTTEDVFDRMTLQVDEFVINEVSITDVVYRMSGTPQVLIDPDTGLPVMSMPEGAYIACFTIELSEGLHTATFIAEKTSGEELRYTWSFYLTDW